MGVAPFVTQRLMSQAVSSNHYNDEESNIDIKHGFFDYLENRKEEERKHDEIRRDHFEKYRDLALDDENSVNEITATGLFTTDFNKQFFKNSKQYITTLLGYFEDIYILIISKSPISIEEKETIINAFLFLTITEENFLFSEADFEVATKIGGYTKLSHSVESVQFNTKYKSLTLILD